MIWKYWILIGCLASHLLVATGCATTYRSPGAEETPISELAILSISQRDISVRKIDGKLLAPSGTIKRFELEPGTRRISAFLVSGYARPAELIIEFDALAGEQYELKGRHNDEIWRWEVWIVKAGTDAIVKKEVADW